MHKFMRGVEDSKQKYKIVSRLEISTKQDIPSPTHNFPENEPSLQKARIKN